MSSLSAKRVDRGRPPGPIVQSKPARKNSTSSTNSSISSSRATRSDTKNLPSSLLSTGLEAKNKQVRKKSSGIALTDTLTEDSDSDVEENVDLDDVGDADVEDNAAIQNDSCFKEELFSDDEEKEKLEDVKRDDITELEKNISIEENAEDIKDAFFGSVNKETNEMELTKDKVTEAKGITKKAEEESITYPTKESENSEVTSETNEVLTPGQTVTHLKVAEEELKTITTKTVSKIQQPESIDRIQQENMSELFQPEKVPRAQFSISKTPLPDKIFKAEPLEKAFKIELPEKVDKTDLPEKLPKTQLQDKVSKSSLTEFFKVYATDKTQKVYLPRKISKAQLPDKLSKNQQPDKVTTLQLCEKIPKTEQPEKILENKKSSIIPQTAVVPHVNKNGKSTELIPNLSSSSEVKSEQSTSPLSPPKITSLTSAEHNKKDVVKSTFPQNSNSLTENKNLTFAGLEGLIQINPFERLNRSITRETSFKVDTSKSVQSAPIKTDFKATAESKGISSLYRPEKTPMFGSSSILNPPRLSAPITNEEKPLSKSSIFNFAMKLTEDKEQSKLSKASDSPFKLLSYFQKDSSKEKTIQKSSDIKILKAAESSDKKIEPPPFRCMLNPSNSNKVKMESSDQKSVKAKDSFDLLVEGSSKTVQKKSIDTKDIFSMTFSNANPKGKITDQPYNKFRALSAENICCTKPKRTETFDLSKTIPSILERLKKDVVADIKGTESPPPQKDELSFNFLRGYQDSAKSLSRSESSNSLRICEDTSDTNDSNTDSKDLLINEKYDALPVVPSTATDNAVSCPNENLISQPIVSKCEASVAETTQSSASSTNSLDSKVDMKGSLKTSVITVSSTKSPVSGIIDSEIKKDIPEEPEKDSISKEVVEKVDVFLAKDDLSKLESAVEKEVESKSENSLQFTDKGIASESLTETNNVESGSSVKLDKSTHSKNYDKDSVFDDLLKIKSIKVNFSQSSVIMWNTETKESTSNEEKSPTTCDEIKISANESSSATDMNQTKMSKDESSFVITASAENSASLMIGNEDLNSPDVTKEIKSEVEDNDNPDDEAGISMLIKKEIKKKRLGKKLKKCESSEGFEKEDKESKLKEGKGKSKKRRLDEDFEKSRDPDYKTKSKKIKKNKNKKRFSKHEDMQGEHKKADGEDDVKDISEKIKKKEKRKNDKKFFKSGMKGEFSDFKAELRKRKGKKNRDKPNAEKKDFPEKKTKKKKKLHLEENQDTDSEKEAPHKSIDKKKKKDRKKFKSKDSSSSDDAGDKFFKDLSNLPSSSNALMRQDSKSDDPDMSFLLCEEKVPASPVGISNLADDTSGSSSIEGNQIDSAMGILPSLPSVYPCIDNIESSDTLNKHSIDTSTVLDNTPPTTPSSTESLLSSSPSHERDSFSMNYPESTQSGRDSGEGESDLFRCNSNRTIVRGSDEYHAATTLAFAVGKSVTEKSKDEPSESFKSQKLEADEHQPAKRKKKSKRVRRSSESAKSPRHKSSFSRLSKSKYFFLSLFLFSKLNL